MFSINEVKLIGTVGKDCEVTKLKSGTTITKFSIATTKGIKKADGSGWDNKTTWHNIVTFGKTAEYCEKTVLKGTVVYVNGEIQIDEYEDKDKIKRKSISILAQNVSIVSKPNSTKDDSVNKIDDVVNNDNEDDLPF